MLSDSEEGTKWSLWTAIKKNKRPKIYSSLIKKKTGSWAINSWQETNDFSKHQENFLRPYDTDEEVNITDEINSDKEKMNPVISEE